MITVVNVDNGRSIECWTSPRRRDAPPDELVHAPRPRSSQIADLDRARRSPSRSASDAQPVVTPLAPGGARAARRSRGLAPRRDLGQNFVADPNTVRRIAHLAGVGPGDHVVEIGAGLGSLTLALAETGADVTAVEVDRGLVARRCARSSPTCRTSRSSRPTR